VLQERQMEVMRGKYKTLEFQMADLPHGARQQRPAPEVPPLGAGRAGGAQRGCAHPRRRLAPHLQDADGSGPWFAHDVSDDARLFANSLATPYCGPNNDFEAVRWLAHPETVQSTVILPLRLIDAAQGTDAFGLLILGAEDPQRFAADMATDFLINIGETASAALTCLLD
jgi:uncharacterized protein YigA (DUF484 family)